MSDSRSDRVWERFQLIANGPALFNAVVSGLELDVFSYLSRHPGATFSELQTFTGLATHQLRVLMLALCASELVEKREEGYHNSDVAESSLAANRPDSWRNTLIGWKKFQYPAFPYLTTALRTGENAGLAGYPGTGDTLYDRLSHDAELEAAYHDSIAPFTHLFAHALVDNPEFAEVTHLLDVGGGDGTTAVRFAEQYPALQITVFDLPSVAEHGARSVPPEYSDRVRFYGGDIFSDPFPTDVDGILFSHVLEPFSAEHNIALLTRAYQVLPFGGRMFAYGMTASDDERSGLLAARLSLFLNVLASGVGMAHPAKDYAAWLRQSGCTTVTSYTGLPYEHGLIVGVKT